MPHPEPIQIWNKTRGICLGDRVELADTFFSRLQGLLGRSGLAKGEGLIIEPCNSIHTFFMGFGIDVVFLDREQKVVAIYPELPPWRLTRMVLKATSVIEFPAGTLAGTGTSEGDVIERMKGGSQPLSATEQGSA